MPDFDSLALTSYQDFTASLSVSEFSQLLQKKLDDSFPQVWVTGELSGLFKAQSGHVYATLKDQHAQLKIVVYNHVREKIVFALEEGLKVKVLASPSVYKPRGDLQLIVKVVEPDGQGPLKLAFDQIKAKLTAEGLFNPAHKKRLPAYPKAIGLITSTGGAVLHDMMRVLMRRYPIVRVHVYSTPVQGKEANAKIIKALEQAAAEHFCDAYIIARGGGSLEDLWCFNSEDVVRAIYAFPYPIISAIGHETDVTLADLVADVRAATPSVAAELIVPDLKELYLKIESYQVKFMQLMSALLQTYEQRVDYLIRLFKNPEFLLERLLPILGFLEQKVTQAMQLKIDIFRQKIKHQQQSLLRVLLRADRQQVVYQHKVELLLNHVSSSLQQRYTALEKKLEFAEFKMNHLDPVKRDKPQVVVTTLDNFVLTSACSIKPKTQAYLKFPDGQWEIEFVRLLS